MVFWPENGKTGRFSAVICLICTERTDSFTIYSVKVTIAFFAEYAIIKSEINKPVETDRESGAEGTLRRSDALRKTDRTVEGSLEKLIDLSAEGARQFSAESLRQKDRGLFRFLRSICMSVAGFFRLHSFFCVSPSF